MSTGSVVLVVGAAGRIGSALSLLIASSGKVSKLILNDIEAQKHVITGLEAELNHIDMGCKVVKCENLEKCDSKVDFVLMPCGRPQSRADEKRDDLFKSNAEIFQNIMNKLSGVLVNNPVYVVIGNPVNSLTVVCADALKKLGKYDSRKLIGFNELDVMRARRMTSDRNGIPACDINVPVIGGHSEKTICGVFESAKDIKTNSKIELNQNDVNELRIELKNAGDAVLAAYDSKGTSVFSTALSISKLLINMIEPSKTMEHYAYIEHGIDNKSLGIDNFPSFFTCPITLNSGGIDKVGDLKSLLESIKDKKFMGLVIDSVRENIETAKNVAK